MGRKKHPPVVARVAKVHAAWAKPVSGSTSGMSAPNPTGSTPTILPMLSAELDWRFVVV